MVMTTTDIASARNLNPIGRVVGYGVAGVEPTLMGIGPVEAIPALRHANMSLDRWTWLRSTKPFPPNPLPVNVNLVWTDPSPM